MNNTDEMHTAPAIILIGGGGHCAACIDVIELEGNYRIIGILDSQPKDASQLLGYPLLGDDSQLPHLRSRCDYVLITVGQIHSPVARSRLFELTTALGYQHPVIVSPRAYVSRHAHIGAGSIIMHDALVNSRAQIGNNCIINSKALIEHDATIADHCHISTAAIINGGTIIKSGTFIGSNAVTKEYVTTRSNDFIKACSLFTGYNNEQN